MAGSIMEYPYTVWYTTHSLHVKQYHKRNSSVLASVGFAIGVGCRDSCPWCCYYTCSLADVFILYCWDPLAVSFSRVSFVGELPSEQNNFVRRAPMPSWKFSTFDLYFDIDIKSETNRTWLPSPSPCVISNRHHGRGRTPERELQNSHRAEFGEYQWGKNRRGEGA
jgi:hypothetical protein